MSKKQFFISLATAIILIAVSAGLLLLAQGYRLDITQRTMKPTGILVVNSTPDGALIFLNNEPKSATQASLTSLEPGNYQLRLEKQGFAPYQREIRIQKELVTKVEALLAPLFPELKPLTFTGAQKPSSSPDNSKIAFVAPTTQIGWWLLELSERPFNLSNSPSLLLTDTPALPYSQMAMTWGPDNKEILLEPTLATQAQTKTRPGPSIALAYLFDLSTKKIEALEKLEAVEEIQKLWQTQTETAAIKLIEDLPRDWQEKIGQLQNPIWSPDGTKILYQKNSNEEQIYKVFDLKPKEMFLPPESHKVDTPPEINTSLTLEREVIKISKDGFVKVSWYPDSQHLLILEKENPEAKNGRISLVEIDGGNLIQVFSGQMVDNFLTPFSNGSKIVILTNFNPESQQYNLYSINLR